jgi:hypothetical protein
MSSTPTQRSHSAAELRVMVVADDPVGPDRSIRTSLRPSAARGPSSSPSVHYRDRASFACSSTVTLHFPNVVQVQR